MLRRTVLPRAPQCPRMLRASDLLPGILGFVFFVFTCQPLAASGPVGTPPAQEAKQPTVDQGIDKAVKPATELFNKVIFFSVYSSAEKNADGSPEWKVPFILIWLGGSAVLLTLYFRFVNIRSFRLALRTVRGLYSKGDEPGEITHFQALASAVSGAVGLGNIAGVAVAIS